MARRLARGQPPTNVPGRETSEAGRPIPISGPSDGRLDPSAAAAGHRVAYLQAENRVLRERLGTGRLRLTDAERRLLSPPVPEGPSFDGIAGARVPSVAF